MNELVIDFKFAFQAAWAILTAALWIYIKHVADRLAAADSRAAALQTKLHAVEVGYKADIAALQTNGDNTMLLLREIRQDIKQVADKLDRKADK
ncbi:MAG: hypothetical protein JKY60_07215 [Kordiimonadaceae bacterium]|jgi:hypothetical protein|nr:hypothetical protein [Kordiimonadaceae bacterium]